MPNARKRNAPSRGASLSQLAGVGSSEQIKVVECSNAHITRLRKQLRTSGLVLSTTRTETQLETLLKILQHRGEAGINTPEGVGIGFARIATRVFDLELCGWRIDTVREDVITADGLLHPRMARYILRGRRADFIDPQGSLDLGDS